MPALSDPLSDEPYQRYFGEVSRVIDGDTLEVKIDLWPGLTAEFAIRQRGIDAPEIRRPSCDEEEEHGLKAKSTLERLYSPGTRVRLDNVEPGSFSGRYIANIRRWRSDRWMYLDKELIERELAVEWDPSMTEVPWCLMLADQE